MGLRSWASPGACALALARPGENADPAQPDAELDRVTQQRSEERVEQVAPPPSTDAAAPPSDGAP